MRPSSLVSLRLFTLGMLITPVVAIWPISVAVMLDAHGVGAGSITLSLLVTIALAVCVLMFVRGIDATPASLGEWAAVAWASAGLMIGLGTAVWTDPEPDLLIWGSAAGLLIASVMLRVPKGRRILAGVTGLAAIAGAVAVPAVLSPMFAAQSFLVVVLALILSLTSAAQWWTYEVARKLEAARVVAGELAVAEERLRFAAELHDIQGHHLQVIALKSELAARLGAVRPQEAVELMREVQQLARDALTDTRAVAFAYREVSLGTELSNAVKVMAAAGITAEADFETAPEGAVGRLLGLVVREATTNILRHSEAKTVRLRLAVEDGRTHLMINNDGVTDMGGGGSGLSTLAARMAEAGGRLRWTASGGEFTVTATLGAS